MRELTHVPNMPIKAFQRLMCLSSLQSTKLSGIFCVPGILRGTEKKYIVDQMEFCQICRVNICEISALKEHTLCLEPQRYSLLYIAISDSEQILEFPVRHCSTNHVRKHAQFLAFHGWGQAEYAARWATMSEVGG